MLVLFRKQILIIICGKILIKFKSNYNRPFLQYQVNYFRLVGLIRLEAVVKFKPKFQTILCKILQGVLSLEDSQKKLMEAITKMLIAQF